MPEVGRRKRAGRPKKGQRTSYLFARTSCADLLPEYAGRPRSIQCDEAQTARAPEILKHPEFGSMTGAHAQPRKNRPCPATSAGAGADHRRRIPSCPSRRVGGRSGAIRRDAEDRQGRCPGQPIGRDRAVHGRHLCVMRRCARRQARLPADRGGQVRLRNRSPRGHGHPVRGVPEHGRSGRPQQASPLQLQRELVGLAQVRADQLRLRCLEGSSLLGGLSGMGRQALRLCQLPALGAVRQLALQRPSALEERE